MRKRISDQQKLDACLAAMKMILDAKESVDPKPISALLCRQIGPGWTIVTAAQWLTGKAAWGVIEAMGPDSMSGGCNKAEAMSSVLVAAGFCRQIDASGGTDLAVDRLRDAMKAGALSGLKTPKWAKNP